MVDAKTGDAAGVKRPTLNIPRKSSSDISWVVLSCVLASVNFLLALVLLLTPSFLASTIAAIDCGAAAARTDLIDDVRQANSCPHELFFNVCNISAEILL